jgi:hypothetical protein
MDHESDFQTSQGLNDLHLEVCADETYLAALFWLRILL